VGVWTPKRWDMSIAALSQYTTPWTPKESLWIDKSKSRPVTPIAPPEIVLSQAPEPPVQSRPKRRPPSRRIMRHLLRARADAVKAIVSFIDQLEKADGKMIRASSHLARTYGGRIDDFNAATGLGNLGEEDPPIEPRGWRSAKEVVAFLRQRGAKLASLEQGIEGDWAALSSDGEGDSPAYESGPESDIVWVPSGSSK